MRSDIVAGAEFPDYVLPDHTDTPRRLSDLQGDDPMVLVLARGYYCPKDRQQLADLVEFSRKCAVGYVTLVTVTTDDLLHSNELRLGVGADWTFLHDEARIVQRDLEIAEYTDPGNDPMIPHTIVLAPGRRVHSIYNGYWYWGRPTLHELHLDLREVSKRIRPDWRIDRRDARERWTRGERDGFWPYGGSIKEAFARSSNLVDQYAPPPQSP